MPVNWPARHRSSALPERFSCVPPLLNQAVVHRDFLACFLAFTNYFPSHHSMSPSAIVQKLWNYRNVLREDGMSHGDYVEQLTYLLFLKMADERTGLVRLISVR